MEMHWRLYQCFQRVNTKILARIQAIGLHPGQPKVLEFLQDHDGAKPGEIAVGCAIDKSTVASLLIRMDKAGLIRRAPDPKDNRSQNIYLTQQGLAATKAVKEIVADINQQALQDFSQEEKDLLDSLLGRIIANL